MPGSACLAAALTTCVVSKHPSLEASGECCTLLRRQWLAHSEHPASCTRALRSYCKGQLAAGLQGTQRAVLLSHINPASISCRRAFAPLVDAGFLEIVYGGAEQGAFLVNHAIVKSIHLTGSAATYDAIVWGPGKPKVSPGAAHCPVCTVAALSQNAQGRASLVACHIPACIGIGLLVLSPESPGSVRFQLQPQHMHSCASPGTEVCQLRLPGRLPC